jgi:hypothetical protein
LFLFQIFYFRVGEGELSVTCLPEYVLRYALKNAHSLTELVTVSFCVRSVTIERVKQSLVPREEFLNDFSRLQKSWRLREMLAPRREVGA